MFRLWCSRWLLHQLYIYVIWGEGSYCVPIESVVEMQLFSMAISEDLLV